MVEDSAAATMPNTVPTPTEVILRTGAQNFWAVAWQEILGERVMKDRKIVIPPLPTMKAKTQTAMTGGLGWWIPIYLPKELTEKDYPADFVKPKWIKELKESHIKRRPLPGRWVMVETIQKPRWDDPKGYSNGNDPLIKSAGLATRFKVSWDSIKNTHLPKAAKILGLSKKAVRLCTAEEWNLIGNLFLWLNTNRNMTLPDLGSTTSWEWCENDYGGGGRLIVGYREQGGLANVYCDRHGHRSGDVGFRVLAVL